MKQKINWYFFSWNWFRETWQPYPTVYKEYDQILQKVRKGVFVEFTAFQRFVKAEKYAKILVLFTIFSTLIERRIIWLFGLELKQALKSE